MERKLLAALIYERKAYDDTKEYLADEDFSDQGLIIYKAISSFYDEDSAALSVDKEVLKHTFEQKYEKHAARLNQILIDLEPVSIPNVVKTVLSLKKNKIGMELSHALASGNETTINRAMNKYITIKEKETVEEETTFIQYPIDKVVSSVSRENLIKVYPKDLNERLEGGVPKGTHMLVFARPEVGKSLFSINTTCGFLREGKRALYIGNEDPHDMMLLRFFSNLSGMTRQEIQANPHKAEAIAKEKGYDNLIFASLAPGTIHQVHGLIKKHRPEILVVDQMQNLFAGNLTKVERLEQVAMELRAVGKMYGIVVLSVCQAADSAGDKLVLGMGDVYFSNTGIPSQIDVMMGIGMDGTHEQNDTRVVTLCKNKITGNHDSFQVKVNRQLSRVYSVV